MANAKKKNNSPKLGQEIVAVFGVFLAVFLFICLASFTIPDSSADLSELSSQNWGGKVGHLIAMVLMGFLGISSFWFVLLLFTFSFQFFSASLSTERIPSVIAGCTGILIASSGLAAIITPGPIELIWRMYPSGGYLGTLLSSVCGKFLGGPGSLLFFISLLFISFMGAVRFSPYTLSKKCVNACTWCIEYYRKRKEDRLKSPARSASPKSVVREKTATEPEEVIVPNVHEPVRIAPDEGEDFQPLPVSKGEYHLPGIGLLDRHEQREITVDRDHYFAVSKQLEEKLSDFGVSGKVVGISPGPVITTYEFAPAPGVKINKVVSLADDLALGLKAESVRILGSIPGKAAIGIEIPNPERKIVYVRDIFANETFLKSKSKLTLGLGMDVVGNPVVADLSRMPHLLIAGATGSGKSVAVNTIICSILMKATPDEVRLLMVDPKRIELSGYDAIPHLLHPVVVDPKMASRALQWAVVEMERRYALMEEMRVKSLTSYNEVADIKMPLIVIIIDELADLMMVSSREVEDSVARLAQMARAAGMHMILATQRPSTDVLTGLIKANFPTRMSFKVAQTIDSRIILDTAGAEHLLGAGDMLFSPPGTARLQRIHGAFISEHETANIVNFLKEQGTVSYDETVLKIAEESVDENGNLDEEYDEKYDEAVALVCETGQASISMVQRRLRVGYNRAARMIEVMEKERIVGPSDGSKPREVLARKTY